LPSAVFIKHYEKYCHLESPPALQFDLKPKKTATLRKTTINFASVTAIYQHIIDSGNKEFVFGKSSKAALT
jgi:hypothetical protein